MAKGTHGICKSRRMRNKKRLRQNAGHIATIAAEALAVTGVVASVLLCSVPGVGTEPGRSAELDEVYVPLSTGSEKAADILDTANAGIMELPVIRCTCYCTGTITATGKRVREGMISSSREHFGQSANLYTESGELIGTFVCEDTGGKPIKQGKVLDVYRNDIDGVHRWQKEYGDYVRVEWIEREEDGEHKKESK